MIGIIDRSDINKRFDVYIIDASKEWIPVYCIDTPCLPMIGYLQSKLCVDTITLVPSCDQNTPFTASSCKSTVWVNCTLAAMA